MTGHQLVKWLFRKLHGKDPHLKVGKKILDVVQDVSKEPTSFWIALLLGG